MKIKLSSIVKGIEFQTDESQSFLNKLSGEVMIITDEEMNLAESEKDLSDEPEWLQEAIITVKQYLEEEDNLLGLPTKYDFHEYRVIEEFVMALPNEEQRDEMYTLIKGKGAFSKFKYGIHRFSIEDQWYEFRDNALVKLAKNWCKENGIELK